MKIAIIPARAGSKRILNKNIKLFHGKPIIAYTIETAKKAGCFDKIIVSTDDQRIADVAKKYGAEAPFIRPKEISTDYACTLGVIEHALEWCESEAWNIDLACCIYATAPFLTKDDLLQGLQEVFNPDVDYAIGVGEYAYPIQRALKIDNNEMVSMHDNQFENTRSQDLPNAYHDAGQFYWGKVDAFRQIKPLFSSKTKAILLPPERVLDIDTMSDWHYAEFLYQQIHLASSRQ